MPLFGKGRIMPGAKLANVSLNELHKEILRRQRMLPQLIAQRDELDRQIAELQGLGGPKATAPPRTGERTGRRRGRRVATGRAGSLVEKLVEIFQGKGKLSVAEASQAVVAAGYQTKSRNFPTIVAMMLAKDKRFRRVKRGQYVLRG